MPAGTTQCQQWVCLGSSEIFIVASNRLSELETQDGVNFDWLVIAQRSYLNGRVPDVLEFGTQCPPCMYTEAVYFLLFWILVDDKSFLHVSQICRSCTELRSSYDLAVQLVRAIVCYVCTLSAPCVLMASG
jgi:hypothetical protein